MDERFVAAKRDKKGRLSHFLTDIGNEYDYEIAKALVAEGKILNAETFLGKDKETYIRGKVDGDPENNLSELPEF